MAITKGEVQVTWTGPADLLSISSSSNATSLAFTITSTALAAMIELKADNDGTPASGDTVDFYLLPTLGDPDGSGTDEYDTVGHARFLFQLDTNAEDPAIRTVEIPASFLTGKIYAVNNSAGRAITVSATIYETKG